MLHDPEAHEPLVDDDWSEERARAAIRRLVEEADAAFDPHGLWPPNEWDVWEARPPLSGMAPLGQGTEALVIAPGVTFRERATIATAGLAGTACKAS